MQTSRPQANTIIEYKKMSLWQTLKKDIIRNKYAYLMILPVIAYYLIFQYGPMYGVIIAFKDYSPKLGILGSRWVGLQNFEMFINSYYFVRILRNTLLISFYSLLFSFPIPIIFALLLNELQSDKFKRTVQTITYLPHFIAIVVIVSMLRDFLASDGVINDMVAALGGDRVSFLQFPEYFRTIYISSGIWQSTGWNSIIYLSALSTIDQQLYEAASIDGAGRFRKLLHITIPGILPVVVTLLILRLGQMLSVGFEKIMLMYNANTRQVADVISTFVYNRGLIEGDFSYSAAVGLFNSVINFALLLAANKLSRAVNETSLW